MREEVAGAKVTDPKGFELTLDSIKPDSKEIVDAWVKVLKSILPIIVSNLPAEEYQVVRSTDHTEAIVRATRAVLAGVEIVQTTFGDLRRLLKPR